MTTPHLICAHACRLIHKPGHACVSLVLDSLQNSLTDLILRRGGQLTLSNSGGSGHQGLQKCLEGPGGLPKVCAKVVGSLGPT